MTPPLEGAAASKGEICGLCTLFGTNKLTSVSFSAASGHCFAGQPNNHREPPVEIRLR